jgi:hypothetical protein
VEPFREIPGKSKEDLLVEYFQSKWDRQFPHRDLGPRVENMVQKDPEAAKNIADRLGELRLSLLGFYVNEDDRGKYAKLVRKKELEAWEKRDLKSLLEPDSGGTWSYQAVGKVVDLLAELYTLDYGPMRRMLASKLPEIVTKLSEDYEKDWEDVEREYLGVLKTASSFPKNHLAAAAFLRRLLK